jgi:hypothetical protein
MILRTPKRAIIDPVKKEGRKGHCRRTEKHSRNGHCREFRSRCDLASCQAPDSHDENGRRLEQRLRYGEQEDLPVHGIADHL